jgi:hypothetical protein
LGKVALPDLIIHGKISPLIFHRPAPTSGNINR